MEFFQELTESKLFLNGKTSFSKYTARDIMDIFFAYLCAIQFLKNVTDGKYIQNYVKNAGDLTDCNRWKASSNDLYVLLFLIYGENNKKYIDMLDEPEQSLIILSRINKNHKQDLRKYLRLSMANIKDVNYERRFLLMMENDLKISNTYLKSIRRLLSNWEEQSESNKILVSTRLVQIFQQAINKSDLLSIIRSSAKKNELFDKELEDLKINQKSIDSTGDKGLDTIKLTQKSNIL